MFKMKGVIPPMITPFTESGEVDYEGLKTLVNFLKDKVHGLFITGSYGSAALLQVDERKKIAEVVMDTVGGAIPIIVHAGTADSHSTASWCATPESLVWRRYPRWGRITTSTMMTVSASFTGEWWTRRAETFPCMSTTIPASRGIP